LPVDSHVGNRPINNATTKQISEEQLRKRETIINQCLSMQKSNRWGPADVRSAERAFLVSLATMKNSPNHSKDFVSAKLRRQIARGGWRRENGQRHGFLLRQSGVRDT
jgi:hypothetical protein